MPIRIRCPKCKQLLQVPSRFAGQVVKCVKCEAKLRVPVPATPADTPSPSAPASTGPTGDRPATSRPAAKPPEADWSVDLNGGAAPAGGSLAAADDWSMDFSGAAGPSSGAVRAPTGPSQENWSIDLSAGPASPQAYEQAKGGRVALEDDEDGDEDGDEDDEFVLRAAGGEVEEMDLTPMVDVTFLLLIFFMITASFSSQKSLEVPPPDPEKEGAQQSVQTLQDFEEYSVIVQIDAQNRIFVDYEELRDPRALIDTFEQKRTSEQKHELIVEADAEAFEDTVVTVIDAANEVGMQKIRIATSDSSGS